MPTPKQAIAEALQSLDHANDLLWTDDGSPLVSEIQRLANDKTITRAQINEALPGFARKTGDSIAEDEQPDDLGDETGGTMVSTETLAPTSDVQAGDVELTPEQEVERLHAIAYKRVQEASQAILDAQDGVSKARAAVVQAEQRHARALQIFTSKYPPLTSAANIKQHLARQQEALRQRVEGARFVPNTPQNPLDAKLMDRKRNNGRSNTGQAPRVFLPRAVGG